MNETPRGERIHIALFGRRNAGKSSMINAITNQDIAIVSNVKGTTTDPVYKAMELLPLGPVVLIDTPGLDDEGDLGTLRINKTKEVLSKTDIALLVLDGRESLSSLEVELLQELGKRKIPTLLLLNKMDLLSPEEKQRQLQEIEQQQKTVIQQKKDTHTDSTSDDWKHFINEIIPVSAVTGEGILEIKQILGERFSSASQKKIVGDLIEPGDFVVLVVPIDKAAPKGRLILPQQQTIRDILDHGGISIVIRDTELADTLQSLGKRPKLVITDSQAFGKVAKILPDDIPLTSFSILFARYKGELSDLIQGAKALEQLEDGDYILMGEGCTHHRQCDDIGTVKIPRWIREYTKKEIHIETSSGTGFPEDLRKYALIVHCGGCTLNEKEMKHRQKQAKEQGVPMVNYGIAIAYMNGILKRSLKPLGIHL